MMDRESKSEHPILLIARSVFLELARRKDVYVLFILIALFLCAALCARMVGIDSREAAGFLLDLGLTVGFWLAAILTVTASGRQIPLEMENRTLYILLARPLSRAHLLLGKWVAVTAAGGACLCVFCGLTLAVVPLQSGMSSFLLVQALLVQVLGLAVLSALTVLLSLWLPKPLAITGGLAVYFGSGPILGLISGQSEGFLRPILVWVSSYVPNFSLLNLVQRLTDSGPALDSSHFFGLLLYGGLFTVVFLLVAAATFRRRAL